MTRARREIATVLFTDIVGSTEKATELGDRAWRQLLADHHARIRSALLKFNGREVSTAGDSFLAVFDNPGHAIDCAGAIRDELRAIGLKVRCGLHMGQVEWEGDSIGGITVHIGSRVAARADAGEILVSGTVRDAEVGSGIGFGDRGKHELKGAPGEWRLYEVTEIPGTEGVRPPSAWRRAWIHHRKPIIAAVVGVAAVAAVVSILARRSVSPPTPVTAGSIAVLPFDNIGGDPENEYFSDGITEEILAAIAKIEDLKVISRTSIMRYKGTTKTTREIGEELGVATILEGSVRREGDRVRITAQLIDASTDEHLWAENYDRDLEDIFAIQTDVAEQIARALATTLAPEVRDRLAAPPTEDIEAYQDYLRGRFFWNKRTAEGLLTALEAYQSAVDRDSLFALAHTGLAETWVLLPLYGAAPLQDAHRRARAAALRALALDPLHAEAHAALGLISWYEWDWVSAEREFQHAIELDPGYATTHQWYAAYLVSMARFDEALEEIERARELDPLSLIINVSLGNVHLNAGRYDAAIEQFQETLEMDQSFAAASGLLIEAYELSSQFEAAITEFERLVALTATDQPEASREVSRELREAYAASAERGYWEKKLEWALVLRRPSSQIAGYYAALGDLDQAFEWLERAFDVPDADLVYLKVRPIWDPLREDPRFEEFLIRMGLAES